MHKLSIGYKAQINLKEKYEYNFLKSNINCFISLYKMETNSTTTIVINNAIIIDDKEIDIRKRKEIIKFLKNKTIEELTENKELKEKINIVQILYYQIIIDRENESFKVIEN